MFVGVGASRVRDLFEQAKKVLLVSFLLMKWMQSVVKEVQESGAGMTKGSKHLNALLVEMDGFDNSQNVIVVAATKQARCF